MTDDRCTDMPAHSTTAERLLPACLARKKRDRNLNDDMPDGIDIARRSTAMADVMVRRMDRSRH